MSLGRSPGPQLVSAPAATSMVALGDPAQRTIFTAPGPLAHGITEIISMTLSSG